MHRCKDLDSAAIRARLGGIALLITGKVGDRETAAQLLAEEPDRLSAAFFKLAGVTGISPAEIATHGGVFAVPLSEHQISAAQRRLHTRVIRKTIN